MLFENRYKFDFPKITNIADVLRGLQKIPILLYILLFKGKVLKITNKTVASKIFIHFYTYY